MTDHPIRYVQLALPLSLQNSSLQNTGSLLTYGLDGHSTTTDKPPPNLVGFRACVRVRGRLTVGVIVGELNCLDIDPERVVMVDRLVDERAIIDPKHIAFYRRLSQYYHQPLGQIIQYGLPKCALKLAKGFRWVTKAKRSRENSQLFPLSRHLRSCLLESAPALTVTQIQTAIRAQVPTLKFNREELSQALKAFQDRGWVRTEPVDSFRLNDLKATTNASPATTRPGELIPEVDRATKVTSVRPPAYRLNPDQRRAVREALQDLDDFKVTVLHGVTGSGKTDVYLRAIAAAINRPGRLNRAGDHPSQILILVPEISLVPQWQKRIREYIDLPLAVSHYRLSDKVRERVWMELSQGKARILIGARSAVLAPFCNLRLIIVDEEHSHLYKDSEKYGFHARDAAILRAHSLKIPIVLGSATPSATTWHNLSKDHYSLVKLPQRAREIELPRVRCIDMRKSPRIYSGFSQELFDGIERHLKESRQVLIYQNSRGYAPSIYCEDCERVIQCRNCHLALHLHKGKFDVLWCHRCLYRLPLSNRCPDCGRNNLRPIGVSTQQVEEIIGKRFQDYVCLRLDSDTMNTNRKLEEAIKRVMTGEVDIIVGTQMMTKGHHFPRVGLVAAFQPDTWLHSSDIFARERLLQDLMQVSGRSGRDRVGEVMIQSYYPDDPLYGYVARHNYEAGMDHILYERSTALMPPYQHLAIFHFAGRDQQKLLTRVERLAQELRSESLPGLGVYAPLWSNVPYYRRLYRAQAWLMASERQRLSRAVDRMKARIHPVSSMSWRLDIDPVAWNDRYTVDGNERRRG